MYGAVFEELDQSSFRVKVHHGNPYMWQPSFSRFISTKRTQRFWTDTRNPEVIPRNVAEERALPPQGNSLKTFVMARGAPVPGNGKRLKICQFGWLPDTEKFLNKRIFWLRRPATIRIA
jgi:hypothetical protein